MPLEMLWFIASGFALGFATSTLWEWFYYRQKRISRPDPRMRARVAALETELARLKQSAQASAAPTEAEETQGPVPPSAETAAAYQSRAALLDSEQAGLLANDAPPPNNPANDESATQPPDHA